MTINFGRHDFGSKVADSDFKGSDRANFSGEKKKKVQWDVLAIIQMLKEVRPLIQT